MHKRTGFITPALIVLFILGYLLLFMYLTDPSSPQNTQTPQQTGKPQVDLVMASCDLPFSLLERLGSEIQREIPENISIVSHSYPADLYYNTLNATLKSSTGPDLIMLENPAALNTLIASSELLPLDNYIDITWRTQLGVYSSDNSVYFTPPLGIRCYTIYYNKSLAKKLGFQTTSITIDNFLLFLDVVKASGYTPIAFETKDSRYLKNMLVSLCPNPNANDPWQESLDRLQLLKPYLAREPQLYDYEDAKLQFKGGKVAVFFGVDTEFQELSQDGHFEVGTISLLNVNSHTVWFDYIGMCAINKNTPHKREALMTVQALSGDVMLERYRSFSTKPADQTVDSAQYAENWMYKDNGAKLMDYSNMLSDMQWNFSSS